jgi:hypothetical protein
MKKHDAKDRLPLSTKLAVLTTLSLLLIGSTLKSSHAEPVRISVSSTDLAYLATAVAWKRGFFADEELNVEIIRMNANVDVDYTMLCGTGVRAALRGFPVKELPDPLQINSMCLWSGAK